MLSLDRFCNKIAPAARILGSLVRLPMNLFDDRKVGRPKSIDDLFWPMTSKV